MRITLTPPIVADTYGVGSSAPEILGAISGSRLRRSGLFTGWHLCSLDAPSVAALWTWFAARECGIAVPKTLLVAMAVAVWILYAGDRLLDARGLRVEVSQELEARHYFHWRHRRIFLGGIAVCAVALGFLLPGLPVRLLEVFGVEGVLLVGWFGWIHRERRGGWAVPKEPVVGAFFAAAVFLPVLVVWANVMPMLLFAALLTVNGLFIRVWEQDRKDLAGQVAAGAWVLFGMCTWLSLAGMEREWALAAACAVSAGLLLGLHELRERLEATTLRAAADAVLLTPLLFLALGR